MSKQSIQKAIEEANAFIASQEVEQAERRKSPTLEADILAMYQTCIDNGQNHGDARAMTGIYFGLPWTTIQIVVGA